MLLKLQLLPNYLQFFRRVFFFNFSLLDLDPGGSGSTGLVGWLLLVKWFHSVGPMVSVPPSPPAKTKPGPPRPICFPLPSYTQCTHCQKKLRNVHTSIYVRPICLRNICTIKMSVSQHLKLEVRNCPPFSDFLTLSSF